MYKIKIQQLWQPLRSFFTSLPAWMRRDFMWGFIVVPALFILLIYNLSEADVFGWQESSCCKNDLEILHPMLLAFTLMISILGLLKTKDISVLCLCFLCGGALAREILGQGYTFVFVISIVGVIVYANQNLERMTTLLKSKLSSSLLGMCFICYFISQLFDRGIIKRIGWLVTMDTSWKPPYSSNIEESLETLGGLFLLLTVISIIVLAKKRLAVKTVRYKKFVQDR
jgi:hypothetical protein